MDIKRFLGRAALGVAALAAGFGTSVQPVSAQWVQEYEQFYLPAGHNWEFRDNYMGADRLFNAFDYGHAILYEKLYTEPHAPASVLEEKEYNFLTRKVLVRPPRVPLAEGAIEIAYAKLAPEAKQMFHWSHILHRQAYDIWADESLSVPEKDAAMAELLAYYKSRPDIAFSALPKSMEIMDGHYYSLAFREKYPKFNGLIWAYHWMQVGLYEPLIVGRTLEERKVGVNATVGRFWQMLRNAPEHMPYLMPMTAAVAPEFAKRYPEMAIIFDNLHMMHDVVSDILASPKVPREKKREEILRAAAMFRDSTSYAITRQEWWDMAQMMGLNNMGGPSVGFLAALPEPTVPRGMSMAGMDHGNMAGMQHGQPGAAGGHAGMQHGSAEGAQGQMQGMDHSRMGGLQQDQTGAMQGTQHGGMQHGQTGAMPDGGADMKQMMEMHERMMADPVIRERVGTDPVLQRMMQQMQQMHGGPGMNHGATERTQGMNHGTMQGAGSAAASDSAQAIDFAVRLLSDPEVEARIHADPRLHRLWSDPEVQRRLAELRRQRGIQPAAPAPQQHQH